MLPFCSILQVNCAYKADCWAFVSLAGRGPSRDDLKVRLQRKLEVFRAQRHAEQRQQAAQQAKQWASKQQGRLKPAGDDQRLQKRKQHGGAEGAAQPPPAKAAKSPTGAAHGKAAAATPKSPASDLAKDVHDLAFGTLELGSPGAGGRRGPTAKGGAKGGATKKLGKAALLKRAEQRAEQRKELEAVPEGKEKLQREAWQVALSKAEGVRVLDDPRLLRRSLKKETKAKEKRSSAWKERVASQKEDLAGRQKKRQNNLQARITAKADKKKNRRDKKLMRAGFEGRRDTVINAAK